MGGKIITTLAQSLDGFIADETGGYDWIAGQGDDGLDTEQEFSFSAFLSDIDIVVMGNRCYQEGFAKDFADKQVYVAARADLQDTGNIHFINGDIVKHICKERDAGKNIFLFGGGILLDAFIKADVIDEYIIGIVPLILGKGRPLFLGDNPEIKLHLESYHLRDGIFDIHYSRRK